MALARAVDREFRCHVAVGRESLRTDVASRVQKFLQSVDAVQSYLRAFMSQRLGRELERRLVELHRDFSVCRVQRAVRMFLARSLVGRLKIDRLRLRERRRAADLFVVIVRRIQAVWRCHRVPQFVRTKTMEEKVEELNQHPRRAAAATCIQSHYRGYVERRNILPGRHQMQSEYVLRVAKVQSVQYAAVRLQSWFRRHLAKRNVIRRRKEVFRLAVLLMPTASERYRAKKRLTDHQKQEGMCQAHIQTVVRRIGDGKKCSQV